MAKIFFTFSTRLYNRRSIVNQLKKYCEYHNYSLTLFDDSGFFERVHNATVTYLEFDEKEVISELGSWIKSINGSEIEGVK